MSTDSQTTPSAWYLLSGCIISTTCNHLQKLLIDNIDKIKNKSEELVYVHILFLCMQLIGMLLGKDKVFRDSIT